MPNNDTKVQVKVLPNAGKNEISGLSCGVWRIKIAAPPDKGKANKELIGFLSDILGLRKDQITLLKGQTSHNKLLAISGLTAEEIDNRLDKSNKR
jgi:uncharacterized protein